MRPTWLIEANVDGLPSEPLRAEVRRQGMACHVVKHLPSLPLPKDIAGAESVPVDACTVFRGTLTLLRHIRATRRWRSGGWCHFANLSCSTYYAYYGPFLLNRDYALLPVAEAVRLADRLFARYGNGGVLFVRPDAVDKAFTGTLADRPSFVGKLAAVAVDPTVAVLVAAPKKITHEWRLLVANGEVFAGSQYRSDREPEVVAGCPGEVTAFAQTVLREVEWQWRPDPLFVMDVCASEDGLRLLELNSFSCSGHYLADLETVVRKASELAALSW
jgi:hypothetical protein